jgi:hypothetical protein
MVVPNLLIDALVNVRRDSGASDDYAKGLVIGVVSALMAESGCCFESVAADVARSLPVGFELDRLPDVFVPHGRFEQEVRVALQWLATS